MSCRFGEGDRRGGKKGDDDTVEICHGRIGAARAIVAGDEDSDAETRWSRPLECLFDLCPSQIEGGFEFWIWLPCCLCFGFGRKMVPPWWGSLVKILGLPWLLSDLAGFGEERAVIARMVRA
ncbi:hypothetical protein ACLOJK_014669 [Asimina triloba]